jgi:MFS superfamily sulfate permease-like transporter
MAQLGIAGGREQVVLAASSAVLVGVLCVVSGALRLGFIANFLSRPVLTGYLCGISLSLLASQINRFTMVDIQSPGLLRPLWELAGKADLIHIPTLIFGMATFFSLRGLKRFAPALTEFPCWAR